MRETCFGLEPRRFHREQARSHSGRDCCKYCVRPPSGVGVGLLAKAAGQLASMLNIPPSSRASPLPHWVVVNTASATAPNPSGSELARDEIDTVPDQNKSPASPVNPAPTAPTYTPPPTHASLRLCLQLRQNSPACAPCPGVLSFPCHCPSVVGFSSPVYVSVHESHQSGIACS